MTGVKTPEDGTDAANKEYVDDVLETRPLIFSMDLSDGKSNAYIITNILNGLGGSAPSYPIQGLAEDPTTATARGRTPLYRNGITARILCTILSNSTTSLDLNPLLAAGKVTAPFLTDLSGSSSPAVTNYSIGPASVPPSPISTTRIVKVFAIVSGSWSHIEDINVS